MNKIKINYFWVLPFAMMVFGCTPSAEKPKEETAVQEATKPAPQAAKPEAPRPKIFQKAFLGISPGDPITKHQDRIEKGVLRTGEGNFESYKILAKGFGAVGYFMPDPKNPKLVGDITINSSIPSTEDGIRVGDTFGKLLVMYRGLEVHGSEIESRTYAYKDNLLFRINEPHNTYELELSAISKKAKIIEIVIRRQ